MSKWISGILNQGIKSYCSFSSKKFIKALSNPRQAQESILFRLLKGNQNSLYGKEHNFSEIKTIGDYQAKVPIVEYHNLHPWIEKITNGENNILCAKQLSSLCPSSGTTQKHKWIPYNTALKKEFMNGVLPWIHNLMTLYPKIKKGRSFWVVTPSNVELSGSEKIKMGFEEDQEYFSLLLKPVLNNLMVLPPASASLKSEYNWRYNTLFWLLKADDMTWMSLWNASLFIELLKDLDSLKQAILRDIRDGCLRLPDDGEAKIERELNSSLKADPKRASYLNHIFSINNIDYKKIWPNLELISCWSDAWAEHSANELAKLIPNVHIQAKGLLATEGIASVPWGTSGEMPLAIQSHFMEFEHTESKDLFLAHELSLGESYHVILSTSGGLYRYRLGDIVKVTSFHYQTPCIRFLQRTNDTIDICGEKMSAPWLTQILSTITKQYNLVHNTQFVSPHKIHGKWTYIWFISNENTESLELSLSLELEKLLCESMYYHHARKMKQLEAAFVIPIPNLNQRIEAMYPTSSKASVTKQSLLKPPNYAAQWPELSMKHQNVST